MKHSELHDLYSAARSRHLRRRDDAIRDAVLKQGSYRLPRPHLRQQLRAWFDGWEQHLWETYDRGKRSRAVLARILEAMERNIKKCGCASDIPRTSVRREIMKWYEVRHWNLWREFCRLTCEEPSIQDKSYFMRFYDMPWKYERQIYRDGNAPLTFAPSKSKDDFDGKIS